MPDWPARMTADVAAMYMGISLATFRARYGTRGVKEGGNVLWARRQLDRIIDAQFSLEQVATSAVDLEPDTWADLT
jgi:hypothetical protein